jgi:hypothetical protein
VVEFDEGRCEVFDEYFACLPKPEPERKLRRARDIAS